MHPNDKQALRKSVRAAFPGEYFRARESRDICRCAADWQPFRDAQVVAGYIPMAHEADITPLMAHLLRTGRILALPRCEAYGIMTFRRVDSLEGLPAGRWGFPEPPEDAPLVSPRGIDLILVPLEAYDMQGMRLGKGGGYYDRILAQTNAVTLGVAMSHQRAAHVPCESHDIPLQAVATVQGIHVFHR